MSPSPSRLPILVEKAVLDAGYDLITPVDDSWFSASISGSIENAWISATAAGVFLATVRGDELARLGCGEFIEPRSGKVSACIRLVGPPQLHEALRKLHSLQTRPFDRLRATVEERLDRIPQTERTAEVRRRIGQEVFREALFDLWEGQCAISKIKFQPSLLRASHAKPWAVSSDTERLDPFNGLLLAVQHDALFDKGLIAFSDCGRLLIHPKLSDSEVNALALHRSMSISGLMPGHLPYLAFHRAEVARVNSWASS